MAQETTIAETPVILIDPPTIDSIKASNNFDYLTKGFGVLKFGEGFNQILAEGMLLKEPVISPKGKVTMNERAQTSIEVQPIIERTNSGLYVMNGYLATVKGANIKPEDEKTQFFSLFKQKGFNLDQAYQLLTGGSVLNTQSRNGQVREQYSTLDFSTKTESGNYRMKNTPSGQISISGLLTKAQAIGTEDEKKEMAKKLANGEMITVNTGLKDKPRAHLRIHAPTQELRVYNQDLSVHRSFSMKQERTMEIINDTTPQLGQGGQSQGNGQGQGGEGAGVGGQSQGNGQTPGGEGIGQPSGQGLPNGNPTQQGPGAEIGGPGQPGLNPAESGQGVGQPSGHMPQSGDQPAQGLEVVPGGPGQSGSNPAELGQGQGRVNQGDMSQTNTPGQNTDLAKEVLKKASEDNDNKRTPKKSNRP